MPLSGTNRPQVPGSASHAHLCDGFVEPSATLYIGYVQSRSWDRPPDESLLALALTFSISRGPTCDL
jgi:hypothetical protein